MEDTFGQNIECKGIIFGDFWGRSKDKVAARS
jgi:hypothetical protein